MWGDRKQLVVSWILKLIQVNFYADVTLIYLIAIAYNTYNCYNNTTIRMYKTLKLNQIKIPYSEKTKLGC